MSDDIRTRPVTHEFEEGFDKTFGNHLRANRKPGRTLYVWRDGQLVEAGENWHETPRPPVFGDAHYDGLRATDGTDLSSRTKHREYMKANGLAMASDYTETWAAAEKRRGQPQRDPERREQIGRALYEQEKRRGR